MAKVIEWVEYGPIRVSRDGHFYEVTDKVGILTAIRNRSLPLELEMVAVGALYELVKDGPEQRGAFLEFYSNLVGCDITGVAA